MDGPMLIFMTGIKERNKLSSWIVPIFTSPSYLRVFWLSSPVTGCPTKFTNTKQQRPKKVSALALFILQSVEEVTLLLKISQLFPLNSHSSTTFSKTLLDHSQIGRTKCHPNTMYHVSLRAGRATNCLHNQSGNSSSFSESQRSSPRKDQHHHALIS